MITKQTFTMKHETCVERLILMQTALDQVRSNKNLIEFLKIVLAVGNYMNGGTIRGGAFGFKMGSLTKVHSLIPSSPFPFPFPSLIPSSPFPFPFPHLLSPSIPFPHLLSLSPFPTFYYFAFSFLCFPPSLLGRTCSSQF